MSRIERQQRLNQELARIDGRGYKAYKDIRGSYDFHDYILHIDHVQGDPFAAPSRIRILVDREVAAIPNQLWEERERRIGVEDCLARFMSSAIRRYARGNRGTGKSGMMAIDAGKQEILERTAVNIINGKVEARLIMGLPARGRRVLGRQAADMFFDELPQIVNESLRYGAVDEKLLQKYAEINEDQICLRGQLQEKGIVAFIPNEALLPRISGIDDRPAKKDVVYFQSPDSLAVSFHLSNKGEIRGMGIPEGVSLIVGGGFHGKSTLLRAVELGVYNHIPGDGREYVCTVPSAVKIRAEDGRNIEKVDISPFITQLPLQKDTRRFSTENASGSTSQAAGIMEAVEAGCKLLLIDEDTSATNFMIRDRRMQELVAKEKEPITPFIDKVRSLYTDLGVSTVIVMGGSGDYFDCVDTVIMMDEYIPRDVTDKAKEIAQLVNTGRADEGGARFDAPSPRKPVASSFDPSRGKRDVKINAKGLKQILFGRHMIDLSAVSQLIDESQTRAVGEAVYYYAERIARNAPDLYEGMNLLMQDIEKNGLDVLSPYKLGNLAKPRLFEIASAINRMRSLRISD